MNDSHSALLKQWSSHFTELNNVYDQLRQLFGPGTLDSAPVVAMFDLFDTYTSVLAEMVGDTSDWLEWYAWENENGKSGLEVHVGSVPKQVKTTDDLLAVIREVNEQH